MTGHVFTPTGDVTFLYTDGVGMTALNTLTGVVNSHGNGINDLGQIVGEFNGPGLGAFFFSSATGMLNLNARIDPATGWILQSAFDINNVGQIVGYGTHNGLTRAFLLTPVAVPEPSALAVVGLAAVCGLALRRIRRTAT